MFGTHNIKPAVVLPVLVTGRVSLNWLKLSTVVLTETYERYATLAVAIMSHTGLPRPNRMKDYSNSFRVLIRKNV